MKQKKWHRLLCLALTITLLLGLAAPAMAAQGVADIAVRIEQISDNELPGNTIEKSDFVVNRDFLIQDEVDENEMVRVSIILEDEPAISAGLSFIQTDSKTISYRANLAQTQKRMESVIEKQALDGRDLDVVWNLTLAANLISANVCRSDIEKIEAVAGVKHVLVETQYTPAVVDTNVEPNMSLSGEITNASDVWSKTGYTGAGSKIAIIDTGLAIDHISFDSGAFDYAIKEVRDEGKVSVDLMDASKINVSLLNIKNTGATASSLYQNSKVPFAYNYIDKDDDITHKNDSEGEHGSHVAGIAAANRYVESGKDAEGKPTYVSALDKVKVAGNAPDAQLLIMKVFGKNGGAYDSDYMAAIEDAITLGADAINLSLGSAAAGDATASKEYQSIMDNLVNSGVVITISAGNSGYWGEMTTWGDIYNDGVNFDTVGSPGSYTNALTVASIDNIGTTSPVFEVGESQYPYYESISVQRPWSSLAEDAENGKKEYTLIYIPTTGADFDGNLEFDSYFEFIKEHESNGKEDWKPENVILMLDRGTIDFTVKHENVENFGAVACIVANDYSNGNNPFYMDLSGSKATIPCVGVGYDDVDEMIADGLEMVGDSDWFWSDDPHYYKGTITVSTDVLVKREENSEYTMSGFSSWGVPGDLSLKPEITAPGGNIYSVNGMSNSGFESMSGTSMAAPQIAGLAALVQQYIAENGIQLTGLDSRALTQSLLMSTANPLLDPTNKYYFADEKPTYYPVFSQGAGLADVLAAVTTPVTITVNGQNDGKVKVELGDDPGKTGNYTFTFTLHNLSEDDQSYDLSAEVFTQWVYEEAYDSEDDDWEEWDDKEEEEMGEDYSFLYPQTRYMDATVVFSGQNVTDGKVTVKADSTATVTATIQLTEAEKEKLSIDNPAGAYIEAFVFAKQKNADIPELSIPVLGYYGSWTDPSMFDAGSWGKWVFSDVEPRYPYFQEHDVYYNFIADVDGAGYFGLDYGDPWSHYLSAYAGGFDYYLYSQIRNSGNGMYQVTDKNGTLIFRSKDEGAEAGAYLNSSGSVSNFYGEEIIDWQGTNTDGSIVPDGTELTLSMVRAPEYYANNEGIYDWDALTDGKEANGELHDGAFLHTRFIMDSTAPQVVGDPEVGFTQTGGYSLTVHTADNLSIARAELYASDGGVLVDIVGGDEVTELDFTFENFYDIHADGSKEIITPLMPGVYLLRIMDYAQNASAYRIFVGVEPTENVANVAILNDFVELVQGRSYQLTAFANPMTLSDRSVVWSSSDETVATVDENGLVTGVSVGIATITATAKLDSTKAATCEVAIVPINAIATGILADAEGTAKFYEYNFGEKDGLTIGNTADITFPLAATVQDDKNFLVMDWDGYNSYSLKSVDRATGTASAIGEPWDSQSSPIPWDMAYANNTLFVAYGYYILFDTDLDNPTFPHGVDFQQYYYPYFFGIDVAEEKWTYTYENEYFEEETETGNYVLYAICEPQEDELYGTTQIYKLYLVQDTEGNFTSFYGTSYNTDLDPVVYGDVTSGMPLSNLVVGPDGALYYSAMDGTTNVVYRLTFDAEANDGEGFWYAERLGDFGENVWPGLLLEISGLRYDFDGSSTADGGDAQRLLDHVTRGDRLLSCKGDVDVNGDGVVNTSDVRALLLKFQNGEIRESLTYGELRTIDALNPIQLDTQATKPAFQRQSETVAPNTSRSLSVVQTNKSNATSTVRISSEEITTNGKITITYNPDEMTLVSASSNLQINSVNDKTSGAVAVGWATADTFPASSELVELTFRKVSNATTASEIAIELDEDSGKAELPVGQSFEVTFDNIYTVTWMVEDDAVEVDEVVYGELPTYDGDTPTKTGEQTIYTFAGWTPEVVAVTGDATYVAVFNETPKVFTIVWNVDGITTTETYAYGEVPTFKGDTTKADDQFFTYTFDGWDHSPVVVTADAVYTAKYTRTVKETASDGRFVDVHDTDWFRADVYNAAGFNLLKGMTATTFEPYTEMSRAMLVTILWRMEGEPEAKAESPFADVALNRYCTPAVAWAAENQIVNGVDATRFEPDRSVTREEMATMFYRYANYKGYDTAEKAKLDFPDAEDVSSYAIAPMQWAVAAKLIKGSDGKLLPQNASSRAQVAAVSVRYVKNILAEQG